MLKLLSATPSPFARKVRVVLLEKNIPFELKTINPWNMNADIERFNPLGKIPVLITANNETIYDSKFIIEWIEHNYPDPAVFPTDAKTKFKAQQIQVIADGICEAVILLFFENMRPDPQQSKPWSERQIKKISNGLQALEQQISNDEFCVDNTFGIADISVVSAVDYLSLRFKTYEWRNKFTRISKFVARQSGRQSFIETMPTPQDIEKSTI
ncbi:glutathione S-transferase N-terminal domain-containing protein [bacterium]|nr:glutathione S-transferase N-terminal domain-containing protein [bacterium]